MENNNNKLAVRNQISTIRFASFKGREIAEAATQDTPIGKLTNDEPIRQSLRYVFALIGLKAENLPTEIQKMVLLEFIQTELKLFTPTEIKLAFRMAVAGELNVELSHFQNFNAMYLANVMNAYREKRGAALTELNQKMTLAETKREPTEAEKIATFWGYVDGVIMSIWDQFVKTKRMDWSRVYGSDHVFLTLEKMELINLTVAEKNAILAEAETQVKQKLELEQPESRDRAREIRKLRDALSEGQVPQSVQQQIVTRARQISVEQLFHNMINSNIDFRQTIESIKSNQHE